MTISESFHSFVLDQLGRVTDRVRIKRMFGGAGVYSGEHFFALISDDVLYLKVDDANRPDFEARGMQPFRPFGEGGEVMQYYQLPEDLLDDHDALRPWVTKAIDVAVRKKRRKSAPRARATRGAKVKPKSLRTAEPKPKPSRKPKPKKKPNRKPKSR